MSFLNSLLEIAFDGLRAKNSIKTTAPEYHNFMTKLLSNNEQITVEEFLYYYNLRIYNIDSKQEDIKLMKRIDFEGIYILHNIDKDKYYICNSSTVLRKIDRHFRGYGDADIYFDYNMKNHFLIRAMERIK